MTEKPTLIIPNVSCGEQKTDQSQIENLMAELTDLQSQKATPAVRSKIKEVQKQLAHLLNPDVVESTLTEVAPEPNHLQPETTLLDIVVANDQRTATAETNLFTSWSEEFAHGSDTILPIVAAAEHILYDNESITGIQEITWHRVSKSNLSVIISREPLGKNKDTSISGIINTNQGVLYFQTLPNGHRFACPQKENNPIANEVLGLNTNFAEYSQFPLSTIETDQYTQALQSPAVLLSVLVELLTMSASLKYCYRKTDASIHASGFVLKVKNLTLPTDTSLAFDQINLTEKKQICSQINTDYCTIVTDFEFTGPEPISGSLLVTQLT